jgi:succinate dehydrogenase / fumarate reductase cytochrome b subunit
MISFFRNLFCSSLGKKYLMAGTGLLLILFVIGHMAGNLQIFLGPRAINRYGHFLQSNVEILWPARIALLGVVLVHIWSATALTIENRAARPVDYQQWEPAVASYASRTMMVSGVIVAVFIVYHLLHYTAMVQAVNLTHKNFNAKPEFFDAEGRHDIYKMMVVGFSQPLVCLFYIVGVGLLCLHLSHGAGAMWQSLGWKKRPYGPCLDRMARWGAALIFLGYVIIPISIWLKWIQ